MPFSGALGAVIFDFDGLLADTEDLHYCAWRSVLGSRGVDFDEAEYRRHFIRAGRSLAEFLEERGVSLDLAELRAEKLAFHLSHFEARVKPMPGSIALLESLRGRARLGLASSSLRSHLEAGLERLGIASFFEATAGIENALRPKPHPDLFLHVAQALGVEPSRCVVLEDAEKGVLAARAAGMAVVAVPTPHTADNDFSRATCIVDSLCRVDFDLLEGLVPAR